MSNVQFIVNPKKIAWKLYETEIVQLYKPNILILDCGGWATPTTAKNINKVLSACEIPVRVKIKTVKIGAGKVKKIFATTRMIENGREVYADFEFSNAPFRFSHESVNKIFEEEEG